MARPAVGALVVAAGLAATGVQAGTYEAVLAEQQRIGAAAQVLSLDAPGRDRALGLPQRLDHMADRLRPALRDLNARLGVPAPDAFAGRVRVGLDPGWDDAFPGSPGLVVASGPLRPDGSPPDAAVTLGAAFVARSDDRSLALGHAFGQVAAMDARRLGLDPALGGPAVSPGGLVLVDDPVAARLWRPAPVECRSRHARLCLMRMGTGLAGLARNGAASRAALDTAGARAVLGGRGYRAPRFVHSGAGPGRPAGR